MPKIFDRDGNELADFALSEKQQRIVEAGEEVAVLFHTPQLFRSLLGDRTGSFTLRKIGARIVALDAGNVRKYADMLLAVKKARENA